LNAILCIFIGLEKHWQKYIYYIKSYHTSYRMYSCQCFYMSIKLQKNAFKSWLNIYITLWFWLDEYCQLLKVAYHTNQQWYKSNETEAIIWNHSIAFCFYISQTCNKRSPLEQRKSGLIRQVTPDLCLNFVLFTNWLCLV
jgi:hypothetical protein